MKIGIDISQLAYPNTGVATFLSNLVEQLISVDGNNQYILFFSSFRKEFPITNYQFPIKSQNSNVQIKKFRIPPTVLSFLWNTLHIAPIEWFVGDVDVFITSDWAEPPSIRAKKISIIYDLIVYKYPEETHNKTEFSFKNLRLSQNIVAVQKKRLEHVKRESSKIICISESAKRDAEEILGISPDKLKIVYPGL